MNYKYILLFLLMFLALFIDIKIISIFNLPFEFILVIAGVLILDLILSNAFLSANCSKKTYLAVLTVFLMLIPILCNLMYNITNVMNIFFIALIVTGLIIAILLTTGWDQNRLIKYIKDNDFQKVLDYSNKILKGDSDNYLALASKASALRMLGKYSDSLEICNFFLEKHPKDSYFLNLKVDALINLKKISEAEELNNEILSKNPKDIIALPNKAHILFEQGDYEESLEYFEKVFKNNYDKERWIFMGLKPMKMIPIPKEIARIWLSKGLAHKNLQQYSEALESFNKALEFNPDSEEAQKNKEEVLKLMDND